MDERDTLAGIGLALGEARDIRDFMERTWEERIPDRWEELHQQREDKYGEINEMLGRGIGEELFNKLLGKLIPYHGYVMPTAKAVSNSNYQATDAMRDIAITVGKGQLGRLVLPGVIDAADIAWSGYEAARSVSDTPILMYDQVFDAYDAFENSVAAGLRVPYRLAVDPAKAHVVMEDAYSQTWVDSTDQYNGSFQPMGTPHYADILRARVSLGLLPDATIRTLREEYPELPYEASESFSEWMRRNKKTIVDSGIKTWEEVLINQALSPDHTFAKVGGRRMFHNDILDLDQEVGAQLDFAPTLASGLPGAESARFVLSKEVGDTADATRRLQDAADAAGYELWELENPLLRTRDGALGLADAMGDGYGGHGLTSAMNDAGTAADGLALGSGHAEQALLAAGLSGSATTEVLDLMRSAGLDPATTAWGELATAVHVWGDATDTEVSRVIDRLGSLAGAQGGAGSGSAGSGGGSTGVDLGRLMSLAQSVAERRADMGDLNPEHIDHELGKLLGQLGAPGSLEEKLALLQRFFAGSASGIAFGLGPSASSLGFNIPQFASGGTVPGPLGAPQLIVAHGGEHIVPHRATGSPTIIRIELDREVLAQAVLGDLLRLQGREVTLGLS